RPAARTAGLVGLLKDRQRYQYIKVAIIEAGLIDQKPYRVVLGRRAAFDNVVLLNVTKPRPTPQAILCREMEGHLVRRHGRQAVGMYHETLPLYGSICPLCPTVKGEGCEGKITF